MPKRSRGGAGRVSACRCLKMWQGCLVFWQVRVGETARRGHRTKRAAGAIAPTTALTDAALRTIFTAMNDSRFDLAIIGGGPSAAMLAILSAAHGFRTALVEPRDPEAGFVPDSRAFAIVRGGWHVLEAAGIAAQLIDGAQPLSGMSAEDTRGALPPAATLFGTEDLSGSEDSSGPLGYMVEVDQLMAALETGLRQANGLTRFAPDTVSAIAADGAGPAHVTLGSGTTLTADLLVGADGAGSSVREFAGIRSHGWDYPQAVLAVTVQLTEPHGGVARQWFQDEGPFAVLPLTENRANLAWFRRREAAFATARLSRSALEAEINRRFAQLAGPMQVLRDPLAYPLSLRFAETMIAPGIALAGDAVRKINPLAGQGFNLGLKDCAALLECLVEDRACGLATGNGAMLERYERWRRFDGVSTALAMDAINRLYSTTSPLLKPLRRLALDVGGRVEPLRRQLARQASGDRPDLPKLVQGFPLG